MARARFLRPWLVRGVRRLNLRGVHRHFPVAQGWGASCGRNSFPQALAGAPGKRLARASRRHSPRRSSATSSPPGRRERSSPLRTDRPEAAPPTFATNLAAAVAAQGRIPPATSTPRTAPLDLPGQASDLLSRLELQRALIPGPVLIGGANNPASRPRAQRGARHLPRRPRRVPPSSATSRRGPPSSEQLSAALAAAQGLRGHGSTRCASSANGAGAPLLTCDILTGIAFHRAGRASAAAHPPRPNVVEPTPFAIAEERVRRRRPNGPRSRRPVAILASGKFGAGRWWRRDDLDMSSSNEARCGLTESRT